MNFFVPALDLPVLVEASLRLSVVLAAFLLLRPWLRRFAGSGWFGALWLVLLARLLAPWPVETSIGVKHRPLEPLPATAQVERSSAEPDSASVPESGRETMLGTPASSEGGVSAPEEGSLGIVRRIGWFEIWLAGGAAGLLAMAVRAVLTLRLARKTKPVDDPRLLAVFEAIPDAWRRDVELRETDGVDVPTLACLIRSQIWMPRGRLEGLSDAELRHVLLHELGHARRRDLWVQCLFSLAVCVHWFNPLVWFAARWARHDREMACDAWVLARARDLEPEDYGATLLKTMSLLRHPIRRAPNAVAMATSKRALVTRIKTIGGYRAQPAWRGIAGLFLLGCFLSVLTTNRFTGETSAVSGATIALQAMQPSPIDESGGMDTEISTSEQSPWRLYCYHSPVKYKCELAHPETFDALYQPVMHRALDEHGEGIEWTVTHWLEVHDPPNQGDSVSLPASYEFRATAHVAVLRGFWTYEKTVHGKHRKKEWVRRTVAHVTAGGAGGDAPVMRASARLVSEAEIVSEFDSDAAASSNAGHPVTIFWKGKPIAKIDVSWEAEGQYLSSHASWTEAGLNHPNGMFARYLNWTFAVWKEHEAIDIEPGFPWPESRPDFKLPPVDPKLVTD